MSDSKPKFRVKDGRRFKCSDGRILAAGTPIPDDEPHLVVQRHRINVAPNVAERAPEAAPAPKPAAAPVPNETK